MISKYCNFLSSHELELTKDHHALLGRLSTFLLDRRIDIQAIDKDREMKRFEVQPTAKDYDDQSHSAYCYPSPSLHDNATLGNLSSHAVPYDGDNNEENRPRPGVRVIASLSSKNDWIKSVVEALAQTIANQRLSLLTQKLHTFQMPQFHHEDMKIGRSECASLLMWLVGEEQQQVANLAALDGFRVAISSE